MNFFFLLLSFYALIFVRLSPSTSLPFSFAQNGLLQRADSRPSVRGRSCDVSISRQTAEWTSNCVSEPHQPSSTPAPPPTHLLCSSLSSLPSAGPFYLTVWLFLYLKCCHSHKVLFLHYNNSFIELLNIYMNPINVRVDCSVQVSGWWGLECWLVFRVSLCFRLQKLLCKVKLSAKCNWGFFC